jgi:hypothetical protein
MANANKNKGKTWERQMAKDLIEVFGVNFNRVPNSGAFTGGVNIKNNQFLTDEQKQLMTGDIIVPKELKACSFECKFYKEFSFPSLLLNNAILNTWIQQAFMDNGKHTFLVFKINNKGSFVVIKEYLKTLLNCEENSYFVYNKDFYIYKYEGFFLKYRNKVLELSA